MISRLRGRLLELHDSVAVIDVGGVGYEAEITTGAAATLAAAEGAVELFTHLVSREDGQSLCGFANAAERDLFRSLIKVSGVGPKLAITLLSGVSPEQFSAAVADGDIGVLTRVPGIGRKTASRLAMELRDKIPAFAAGPELPEGSQAAADAVQALTGLGYRDREAAEVVGAVLDEAGPDAEVEDLVRQALKRIAA
ncbi:MAG: Holliday junction branch migration protein RuvA [Gammaproteobacteria bacterium]|nr:Holliday junction branch migration protein RuvA [Gammaproteobacteria bacterium]